MAHFLTKFIFLDIQIETKKTDIYKKDTHTGQYVRFTHFEPRCRKTARTKCLTERAERIASNKQHCSDSEDDDTAKIWLRVPYVGPVGEKFVKKLFLCMMERKIHFSVLTRSLYLLVYDHTSFSILNVPYVRQNILGKRTDVLF